MASSQSKRIKTKEAHTNRLMRILASQSWFIVLLVCVSVSFVPATFANKAIAVKSVQTATSPPFDPAHPANEPVKPSIPPQKGTNESEPSKVLQPQCSLNHTYSEMFCQFGASSAASKQLEYQFRLVLTKFDEQNDLRIRNDFNDSHVDTRIATTISRVVKQFFQTNFCGVVARVMGNVLRKESEEVRTPIEKVTAINAYIIWLEASLDRVKQYQPKMVQMMQGLLKTLHDSAEKTLTDLKSLEKKLSYTMPTGNELESVRTHILLTLVDMFFSETIVGKSAGISESLRMLTTERCIELKAPPAQPELEVACAFRFLFDSSYEVQELIRANFALEEAARYDYAKQHPEVGLNQGCSTSRSDKEKEQVEQSSCSLKEAMAHGHECDNIPVEPGHPHPSTIECLKTQIQAKFPARYHNKLLTALNTGGPEALVFSLKSLCVDHSAFVAFSMIDVGDFYQNSMLKVRPDEPEFAPDPQRKWYLIESIVLYFLRAAEQRLSCSIKPVAGM